MLQQSALEMFNQLVFTSIYGSCWQSGWRFYPNHDVLERTVYDH